MAATRPARGGDLVLHRRRRAWCGDHLEPDLHHHRRGRGVHRLHRLRGPGHLHVLRRHRERLEQRRAVLRRRCLWRFYDVILTRGRGDGGRALRDCALVGSGHGDGSSALGDGAFFAVGLGKGGGGLDARRATRGNRLGHRGSGHRGPWAGANLRASRGRG